jgi:multidrug efflux pump subunit AcrB
MFLLGGVARYLFVPLAESVVFAMLASYLLSRTLVSTLAMYLLSAKDRTKASDNPLVRFQRGFERVVESLRGKYRSALSTLVLHRKIFIPLFLQVMGSGNSEPYAMLVFDQI